MPTSETTSSRAGSEDRESMREMLHKMAAPQKPSLQDEFDAMAAQKKLLQLKHEKERGTGHTKPSNEFLRGKFDSHKVAEAQAAAIQRVKLAFYEAAKVVRDEVPCCPEMTRAFNHMEEGCFLAAAAIARSQTPSS